MKAFSGYDEVRTQEYGEKRERLNLGGHICKILDVKIEQYNTKEGKTFEVLIMRIDIEAPDEQAGFYQRRFESDAKADALNAKWKGNYRLTIPEDNSEDFVKTRFKTFITSIEKSNPGYKWNWEENTLVGKVFGGVYGLKQIELTQGANVGMVVDFPELRFVRSTENVMNIEIPNVKLLNGEYISYDEYMEQKETDNAKIENEGKEQELNVVEDNNDDLPF